MTRPKLRSALDRPAEAPAVQVEAVSKRFGDGFLAVDGVSIDVGHSEFLCLLGPSGSGKTTLLRIIGGFETADSGRVLLLGRDATHVSPAHRKTNMVFQSHALFPHLNVRDNVAFGLRMRKVAEGEIGVRVAQALEMVRLPGSETRKVDQLSGGQRQRVAIARAIANDPAVLLLDEPLGALDLRLRMELQDELRRLQRSLGSPFILVTHDQGEAMAMADRIAIMNSGRIEQIGTPDEIYNCPGSLFVARFIGHTNMLRGRVVSVRGSGAYQVDLGGLLVPCRSSRTFSAGDELVLSVKEELVSVSRDGAEGGEVQLPGRIVERTFLGPVARFGIRIGEGLSVNAESRADGSCAPLDVGEEVHIGWPVDKVPVFKGE